MLTSPSKGVALYPDQAHDAARAGAVPPLPRTGVAIVRAPSAPGFPARTGGVTLGAATGGGGGGGVGLSFRASEKTAVLRGPSCCEERAAAASRRGAYADDGAFTPEVP